MKFGDLLNKYYSISGPDLELTLSYFVPETITAKSYFLKQGKISGKLGYIQSGLFRSFVYNDAGEDITTHFFQKGNVLIAMDSFNRQVPAKQNIVALEDSELLAITYEKMVELFKLVPAWRNIARDVDEHKFQDLMNRSIRFQTLSASERYQQLCENQPEIIQKVALKHIASYLGIDIATLSRIRRKM